MGVIEWTCNINKTIGDQSDDDDQQRTHTHPIQNRKHAHTYTHTWAYARWHATHTCQPPSDGVFGLYAYIPHFRMNLAICWFCCSLLYTVIGKQQLNSARLSVHGVCAHTNTLSKPCNHAFFFYHSLSCAHSQKHKMQTELSLFLLHSFSFLCE